MNDTQATPEKGIGNDSQLPWPDAYVIAVVVTAVTSIALFLLHYSLQKVGSGVALMAFTIGVCAPNKSWRPYAIIVSVVVFAIGLVLQGSF